VSLDYTDLFCGYGGSSIGLEAAGLTLRLAANHWDRAIETHAANFPHAEHLIADVSNYDKRRLPRTAVLWASPICTELSPAGGRRRRRSPQLDLLEEAGHVPTPALDRTRATFWDVVAATEVHRYPVVIVENVVEAASWELFDVWLAAMTTLGYNHQFVSVSSAHVGDATNPHAPQWRDRLYIVLTARSLPLPDVRPAPLAWCPQCDQISHAVQSWKRPDRRLIGKYRQQYLYRCPNAACRHAVVEPFVRPAADAIDWTDLGQRIADRPRPLAAATMRRIQVGLEQFARPTMVSVNHDDGGRAYPAHDAPLPTRSTKLGDGVACPPFHIDRRAYDHGDVRRVTPVSDPVGAITATGRPHTLLTPPPWIAVLRNHADASPITDPLATVTTTGRRGGGHQALTVPPGAFIQKHHGGLDYRAIEHMTKSVDDPLPGVVARPNLSLVIPYRKGNAKTTDEPLHTVATRESAALVAAGIDIADCRFRMLKPREHGRAQRFPDSYRVYGNQSEQTMGFGNAVSANVAQWLGRVIHQLLDGRR
jgi:DNA (cytosine-5)-methyltransferase 1